jgi:hypothetical protein
MDYLARAGFHQYLHILAFQRAPQFISHRTQERVVRGRRETMGKEWKQNATGQQRSPSMDFVNFQIKHCIPFKLIARV